MMMSSLRGRYPSQRALSNTRDRTVRVGALSSFGIVCSSRTPSSARRLGAARLRRAERLLQLRFARDQRLLRFDALALAVVGDAQRVVDGSDQRVVRLFDGGNVDHTAF